MKAGITRREAGMRKELTLIRWRCRVFVSVCEGGTRVYVILRRLSRRNWEEISIREPRAVVNRALDLDSLKRRCFQKLHLPQT